MFRECHVPPLWISKGQYKDFPPGGTEECPHIGRRCLNMLVSLLLCPGLDSGSVTGLCLRPCTIPLSGRPERSLGPVMANSERKTVMGAAAGVAGRQRARGGSGAVADDLFSEDQGHLFPACLVLNADFSPLSYVPLSLWSWKDTVKAVFRGSAQVVSEYDEWIIRSPNLDLNLPSVIALKAPPHPPHPPSDPPTRTPTHTPAHPHPGRNTCRPAMRIHQRSPVATSTFATGLPARCARSTCTCGAIRLPKGCSPACSNCGVSSHCGVSRTACSRSNPNPNLDPGPHPNPKP